MFRTRCVLRTALQFCSQNSLINPSISSRPNQFFRNPNNPTFSVSNSPFLRSFHSSQFLQSSRDSDGDELAISKDLNGPPKLFVVQPRLRSDTLLQAKLSEALNLANSLEEQRDGFFSEEFDKKETPPHLVVQNPAARSSKAHADTYFGQGTVDNVKLHLEKLELEGWLDAVFVNTTLSGIQQRNLERAWGKPVLDRVGLIIEIFNAHAQTKEAKLQSELAALMYKRTRLVRIRGPDGRLTFGALGEAEVVSARGRGSGGRGFTSGAGETELQLQRRRIIERRNHLLSQIEDVRRTRALQRAARKRRGGSQGQGLPTVAVVGYTNAGKSTLVSALSDSDLYSDDRLFATVDPRLRSVILPSGKKVLLSDTVGFISDLPVQLVEAFHATLEEVVEADLLVHVLDSSALNLEEQRETVLQVLQQIGVSEEKLQNMIEVWNKIDLLENRTGSDEFVEGEDGEDGEGKGFLEAGEDDVDAELLSEEANDEQQGPVKGGNDDMAPGLSCEETVEEQQVGPHEAGKDDRESELLFEETTSELQVVPSKEGDATGDKWNPQRTGCVETSAIMGVGLQEVLNLIDEKLRDQRLPEKRSFDRKWRPLQSVDSDAAIEW